MDLVQEHVLASCCHVTTSSQRPRPVQVARSENASLQEQHIKKLVEANAKVADQLQQITYAHARIRELEAAAEEHSSTAQRELGRLQSEVDALQGRIERMQKACIRNSRVSAVYLVHALRTATSTFKFCDMAVACS